MYVSLEQIRIMLNLPLVEAEDALMISSICRDTSDVRMNSLFVCIKGERFDGHDFAHKAVAAGAIALLVTQHLPEINIPQLIVDDTVEALGQLAHAWRKKFNGKVIAITGSAGKTTVKEILADILSMAGYKVARNLLNFNNQIGMPLSVLATSGQEDFWVMELGISKSYDMDILGKILEPDVALILNVGVAHTEGLGDRGVAYYKSRLLAYVQANGGKAFVSADYEQLKIEASAIYPKVEFFSAEHAQNALYFSTYLGRGTSRDLGKGKYSISKQLDASGGSKRFEVLAPFYGAYGAENAAAIVAVAESVGLDVMHIQNGFMQASLPQQRFNAQQIGTWHIIDDSYNANPLSMKRMIFAMLEMAKVEAEASSNIPCYAVLGAMGELGSSAEQEHENLGKVLAQSGIQNIFWAGAYGDCVKKGLKSDNFTGFFVQVKNVGNFAHHWKKRNLSPGYVLCKGSRSNKLEELVHIIHYFAEQSVIK